MAERLVEMGAEVACPGLPSFSEHTLAGQLVNKGCGFGGIGLRISMGFTGSVNDCLEQLRRAV